jgi:hypothetical protein
VLLLLAPLLPQLVQRLGDPRRLEPRAAEVGDVVEAALDVYLVGAQAGERGPVDEVRVAALVLLVLGLLVRVGVVWGVLVYFVGQGRVAGRGIPERVRLWQMVSYGRSGSSRRAWSPYVAWSEIRK